MSPGRTVAAVAGLACLALAVLPPVANHDDVFTWHVVEHLLLAMLGPALLALAAPVTFALRTLPARPRRALVRALHSRAARVLGWPPTALLLAVGGAYAYYLTPLYGFTERHPVAHALVHAHMFAAGYLLAWVVAGPDPAPRRPGTRTRLLVLVAAGAAHNVLAKLLYAHALPAWQPGAQLLYYGGDATELLLAVALMAQWYARAGRRSRVGLAGGADGNVSAVG